MDSGGHTEQSIPDTSIVRDIRPTARVYGIEITDVLILMGAIPVALLLVWATFPALDVAIDVGGYLGGQKLPNPPVINLVPWLPGAFLWLLFGVVYLGFRRNRPLFYLKDWYQELNEAIERMNGVNPNIWEMGPDFEIDAYELEDKTSTHSRRK